MALTLGLYCFIMSMVWPELLSAFDSDAHVAISLRSLQPGLPGASNLDNFLKTQFPTKFSLGIQQPINGKVTQDWIAFGSVAEDSPFPRVQQHFHDPTKVWTQAGLSTGGESSVIWSQNPNQSGSVAGGDHSWHDARDSYFAALTGTTTAEREQAWAETFQTLGHLIHLVQDAATPSHTRNDLHLSGKFFGKHFGDTDRFHVWADEDGLDEIEDSSSQRYDPSILNLGQNLSPLCRLRGSWILRSL